MTDARTDAERAAAVPGAPRADAAALGTRGLTAGYERAAVLRELDVDIPERSFTVIVGPNACGKSTLLRSMARLLRPAAGQVVLGGEDIARLRAKELARRLGLLPQSSTAPDGITVADLVSRGRHPHQSPLRPWSSRDEAAVREALAATRLTPLARRPVDALSGGQRQRVWIAMVLAQETPLLLLDEPTTFLDLAHQLEVLDLCTRLHREGRTLVAVLHDLNQAARHATWLIAMKDGRIAAQGPPGEVVTGALVEEVFGVRARVIEDPETGTPLVVPRARPLLHHPDHPAPPTDRRHPS
ncbi:ABC transporter ATP-binding protein [Streptomyces marincola]|uniref:ABC transporter ATP-binding protein n=1 Tax=Streptomyces marincola TaxID=2878388 RepID=UPI001CF2609E|nr:ABC transporter ATP-binding protein [Streptomyces marincola]UCM91470.1 ABC transporter ATP-binding protein [Streptomyces marincola]